MALPLQYNLRNALTRWRSTSSTVVGITVVVAVYVGVQTLAVGIEKVGANTGDPRNLLITRQGATSESASQVTLEQYQTVRYLPGIAKDASGEPLISADLTVVINTPRIDGSGNANTILRGISPRGIELRPQVHLTAGRWFTPGQREAVVSGRLASRFGNMQIGDSLEIGPNFVRIVGHFDGDRSAFDSELWMDSDEVRALFDRSNYSSLLVRVVPDPAQRAELLRRIDDDKRFKLRAQPEVQYYYNQTKSAEAFKQLGSFLAAAMSVGAIFAAMNTMYASVASRTREIGTLRVLGFSRRAVLLGFILEGSTLAVIGGVLGCALATGLSLWLRWRGISIGSFNPQTFGETVFDLRVSPELLLKGIIFSALVGVLGSLLPALRAARLPVIAALKAS